NTKRLPDVRIEIPCSGILNSLPSDSTARAWLRILKHILSRIVLYRPERAERSNLRCDRGALRISHVNKCSFPEVIAGRLGSRYRVAPLHISRAQTDRAPDIRDTIGIKHVACGDARGRTGGSVYDEAGFPSFD